MRKNILFIFLFLCFPILTNADVKIIIKDNVNTMGNTATITQTLYGKDNKVLLLDNNNEPSKLTDLIQQKQYTILSGLKKVDVTSHSSQELATLDIQLAKNITIQKTGKTTVINGFKCEEYSFSLSAGSGTICASKDINTEAFGNTWNEIKRSLMVILMHGSLPQIDGLPIRIEYKSNQYGISSSRIQEVQTISYDIIPNSQFIIPENYKIEQLP